MPSVIGTVAAGHRYPSLRSVATATSTSSATMSVTSASYTTAPVAGDLLVAIVSISNLFIGSASASVSTGWTLADSITVSPFGSAAVAAYTRTATATSADTLTVTGTWRDATTIVECISNVSGVSTTVTSTATGGTTIDAPAITTATPSAYILRAYAALVNNAAITAPTGYTVDATAASSTSWRTLSCSLWRPDAGTTAAATATSSIVAALSLSLAIQ